MKPEFFYSIRIFHGKNIDETWFSLKWVAWDSFEFEKASRVSGYSFHDPCAFCALSYYTPLWCDMCNSSDHNITSCPYYASPRDKIDVVLTLPSSSVSLAQCTGFEGGEPFSYVAGLSGLNACLESEGIFNVVHDLDRTPSQGHHDVFVHEESSSFVANYVIPSSLERFCLSLMHSQPSFFPRVFY